MRRVAAAGLLGGLLALAGCVDPRPPVPEVRAPAPQVDAPASRSEPSARSAALSARYARLERDLLARGLLRADGGGPDTAFDAERLAETFMALAFAHEPLPLRAGPVQPGRPAGLRRWAEPVRIGVAFGASVPAAQTARDAREVAKFAARLNRITGHPIGPEPQGPGNFTVLFMGEDDTAELVSALRRLIPGIGDATVDFFARLPEEVHCLVLPLALPSAPHSYARAVALVRAEHPPALRLSCIHEEIAQGLGLPNDSPAARPSIFNDDDEFGRLTTHDAHLLAMLYDARLVPGMSAAQARAIVLGLAAERVPPG